MTETDTTADMTDRESRIRERAMRIWDSEGRPEDRHDVHLDIATRIVDEEDAAAGAGTAPGNSLDIALADSMAASDPPSQSQPTTGIVNLPDPDERIAS